MPPSGYAHEEVEALSAFLGSCSRALGNEASSSGRTLEAALAREIEQIVRILPDSSLFGRPILELTAQFYRNVLRCMTLGLDYPSAVAETLRSFAIEVSSIHVPT